jgi:DNA-binding NarL/FixJ family response regulator
MLPPKQMRSLGFSVILCCAVIYSEFYEAYARGREAMKKPRVLLADDHDVVLEGIRTLLEPEADVVGTVRNGRELIPTATQLKPDIILLDISMPGLNGIEAARQLRKILPGTKLLFLTMHSDADYIADALRLGASGYVLKSSATSEIVEAIQEVSKGRTYVTPLVHTPRDLSPRGKSTEGLTARQREVLQLIAEGRVPKEIASQLGISVRTVEFHKYSIIQKLGVRTVAELTKYAVRHRLSEM